jgi:hypothetical protein
MWRQHQPKWAKPNIDRKRLSYIENDSFGKSQNCCSTGERTVELNIHFEGHVSSKTFPRELHKSNIHGRAYIAKSLEVMLRCVNSGVMTTKLDIRLLETPAGYGQASHPHAVPYVMQSLRSESQPGKPTIRNAWFQQWNIGEVLWWFRQQYRGTVFCWSNYDSSWPN